MESVSGLDAGPQGYGNEPLQSHPTVVVVFSGLNDVLAREALPVNVIIVEDRTYVSGLLTALRTGGYMLRYLQQVYPFLAFFLNDGTP